MKQHVSMHADTLLNQTGLYLVIKIFEDQIRQMHECLPLFFRQIAANLCKDLFILCEYHLMDAGGAVRTANLFIPAVNGAEGTAHKPLVFKALKELGHGRMRHMFKPLQIILMYFGLSGGLEPADGTQDAQLNRCQTQRTRFFIQSLAKLPVDDRNF